MAGRDDLLVEPVADAAIDVVPESRPNIIATGLVTQALILCKPKRTSQVSEKASATTSRSNDGIIAFANNVMKLGRLKGYSGEALLEFILLSIEEI